MRLIRAEYYRMLHSKIQWGMTAALLLLFSRALFYYLWGMLIQWAVMLALLTKYQAWGEIGQLGAAFLASRMLLHMLFGIALLSPPLLISFLLRDVFGSMAVSSGLAFLIQNMLGNGGEGFLSEVMNRFYPAARMLDPQVWILPQQGQVQETILLCTGYLLAGLLLSAAAFWWGELK